MLASVVLVLVADAAAAMEVSSLRGSSLHGRKLDLMSNFSFLDGLPLWAKYLILAGFVVVALLLVLFVLWCCVRIYRRRNDPSLIENPYIKENSYAFNPSGSNRQLFKKNDMTASPALASFMKANPVQRADYDSDDEDIPPPPQEKPSQSKPMNQRVSTRATGMDYGLLDEDAKKRIQSIRMEGKLLPIVPNPSSKAMKLLGVDETAIARPFDEDVATRMKKIAAKSGGGIYSPGLATAALGNQIAQGFKERRAKQLEKARNRKEKEEAKKAGGENGTSSSLSSSAKPAAPPKQEKKAEAPGPNKLAAFLASSSNASPSSKPEPKEEYDEDDEEETEDDSDSEIDDTI